MIAVAGWAGRKPLEDRAVGCRLFLQPTMERSITACDGIGFKGLKVLARALLFKVRAVSITVSNHRRSTMSGTFTSSVRALLSAAVIGFSSAASATVIFDSQALGEPLCGPCVTETRGSGLNYAAVLQFSANVTINQFGMYSSVGGDQNVKFVIFDSLLNGGTGNLLFSQTKFFADNPVQSFLYTDPFSFTFQAGNTYDVGILGDGRTLTGRWIAFQDISDGAITEIARNANIDNFASPTTGGYAGVSPWIQLVADGNPVPEPGTLALAALGLIAAGAGRRRKH